MLEGIFGATNLIIWEEIFSTVASPGKRKVVDFGTCNLKYPFGPSKTIR